jgi:anthranilate synthase/aminodeoxychorismate synthase-like glutamine amidotransferase
VKAKLLLIDNYDSFTYNLVQAFLVLGADVRVFRNDAINVAEAQALAPTHLCISPGPGTPYDAGVSMDMIRAFAGRIPVFGVCLGHQSIVEVFGGKVVRAGRLMHGKTSPINHDGRTLFAGLPNPCEIGRYHSLIAQPDTLPPVLEVTARTPEGEIMGVRHKELIVEGVQFHPESVLTPDGPALMANFLKLTAGERAAERTAEGARVASV